jgi:curved DNA-binding protein CbpA
VAAKNFYDLLGVASTASLEEIRHAFRQQIGRYHPDKVQHLGIEFQDMAAGRAAELTEAYRILSDEQQRTVYDRMQQNAPHAVPPSPPAADSPPFSRRPESPSASPPPAEPARPRTERPAGAPPPVEPQASSTQGSQFSQERLRRDEFLRKAAASRFRRAAAVLLGDYEETHVGNFDLVYVPKSKLFGRAKGPCLLARFVTKVDGPAVTETSVFAAQWGAPQLREEICVFLMGATMAPRRELEHAIGEHRRHSTRRAKVTLIPIDATDWTAHVPIDAAPIAKAVLARLQGGGS